jgi:hypothetical protein
MNGQPVAVKHIAHNLFNVSSLSLDNTPGGILHLHDRVQGAGGRSASDISHGQVSCNRRLASC